MKKILILVIAMVMLFMVNSYADVNKNKANVTSSKKVTTNTKNTKKPVKKTKTTVKNTKKSKPVAKKNTVKTVYVYHEPVLGNMKAVNVTRENTFNNVSPDGNLDLMFSGYTDAIKKEPPVSDNK